jgi:hypothetical protein
MFQKLTPLIVLAIFAGGAYFMITHMDKAVHHTKVKRDIPKK